ncbi:helix-turn-helix transcriptional regulator [Paracoccaceae bacterium Fryx2]|nr:helix-turn-helix transcriptional regulator [Paracoccaceae bacterium Fryx2]
MAETAEKGWFSDEVATFGDRVAGAREAAGLSQEDLARQLGVKLKTVQGWENDLIDPRANKLQMMAGMLNVSIRWMLTGEGDGLDQPSLPRVLPGEARGALDDLGQMRARMQALTTEMGQMEKRLRGLLAEVPE